MTHATSSSLETAFIGKPAPLFAMPSTKNLKTLEERISLSDYRGKWLVLLFYPLDFTFVCPTELTAFSDRQAEFAKEGAEILGVSTDSVFSHRAWIQLPRDKGGLGDLGYPLASDMTREVSRAYGVLLEEAGHTLRGTFIIDPHGKLRYALVHDNDIGRSVDETLRSLQALKSGGLCAVNWKPGDANLAG
ncbi:MAG: peroxiredoxin [Polyangiaceae bacterium]